LLLQGVILQVFWMY